MTTATAFIANHDRIDADPEAIAHYREVVLAHAEGKDVSSRAIADAINAIGGTREKYVRDLRLAMERLEAFKQLQQADQLQTEIQAAQTEYADAEKAFAELTAEYETKLGAARNRAIAANQLQSDLTKQQTSCRQAGTLLARGMAADKQLSQLSGEITRREKEIRNRTGEVQDILRAIENKLGHGEKCDGPKLRTLLATKIETTQFELNELKKSDDSPALIAKQSAGLQAELAALASQQQRLSECDATIARIQLELPACTEALEARRQWHTDWRNMSFE